MSLSNGMASSPISFSNVGRLMTAPAPTTNMASRLPSAPEGNCLKVYGGAPVRNTLWPALGPPTRTSTWYSGAR
ncbi:hypothetical protein D9M68_781960 [compost metagenome]